MAKAIEINRKLNSAQKLNMMNDNYECPSSGKKKWRKFDVRGEKAVYAHAVSEEC